MKKLLTLIITGFFVLSGFGAVAFEPDKNDREIVEKLMFFTPQIEDKDQYVSIGIDGANSQLIQPRKPALPAYTKTMTFPCGTKIKDVTVNVPTIAKQETLSKKIIPGAQPMHPGFTGTYSAKETHKEDYEYIEDLYPEDWLDYWVGSGLQKGEHVVFLTYQFYPVRYSPAYDTIYYTPAAEITITYEEPTAPIFVNNDYDLLIITPKVFSRVLQPLITHKNKHNINTMLKTVEDIYDEYPGVDEAEQIKYFIKDAIETYGTEYVLLVGGRKPGIREKWFLPVRYANVVWANETKYVSDLYYADVYDAEYNFSSCGIPMIITSLENGRKTGV